MFTKLIDYAVDHKAAIAFGILSGVFGALSKMTFAAEKEIIQNERSS